MQQSLVACWRAANTAFPETSAERQSTLPSVPFVHRKRECGPLHHSVAEFRAFAQSKTASSQSWAVETKQHRASQCNQQLQTKSKWMNHH